MMIGEPTRVQIPLWDQSADQPAWPFSPLKLNGNATSPVADYLAALQRFLPSNEFDSDSSLGDDSSDSPVVNAFSCDHFRMYDFKVRRCARVRSHDWTECPYAHPGEKARRRDPRKYHYSGTACPDFRKGSCRKGDTCEFAHGVFECWLHPARYRTQPCKDGTSCTRRVCFFAHTPEQLRILPQQSARENGSGSGDFISSPSTSPSESPPTSPTDSFNLMACMRNLQLGKINMSGGTNWGLQMGPGFVSPRGIAMRPGFGSSPSTPTRTPTRRGPSPFDLWDSTPVAEEPAMERVESGRDLRAKMYAKLCKDNPLEPANVGESGPDIGWISELVM